MPVMGLGFAARVSGDDDIYNHQAVIGQGFVEGSPEICRVLHVETPATDGFSHFVVPCAVHQGMGQAVDPFFGFGL